MKQRFTALAAAGAASALVLAGCASTPAEEPSNPAEPKSYRIGITQIVQHDSLDAAREAFKRAFADKGIDVTWDEQNANGESSTANSIAEKFASDNVDLVLAIATPTAQAAANVIRDIPIVFTAVTEPQAAGLVKSWDAPGGNVTGTSDMNPVAEQIALIKKVAPEAKSFGVIYSSGEVNSEVQVELARAAAQAEGLTIVEKTIENSNAVGEAVQALGDVDAIYVPTDNNVVSALPTVIAHGERNSIPVIVGETDSVKNGGVATYGLDYDALGYQAGQMAIRILVEGANPASMPVETLAEAELWLNKAAAARFGVTFSDALVAEANEVIE